ncbi:hypothetical protein [Nocardia sp. NBC_01329]|uniref:hypothetical protein n=1 Tax=Nocardia sp. NBC_01329 TaxID=2903594 RepID=UPI002E149029|nr:hypothetical protein OG405_14110 [Nocardia sp. NBC_01329]
MGRASDSPLRPYRSGAHSHALREERRADSDHDARHHWAIVGGTVAAGPVVRGALAAAATAITGRLPAN